MSIFFFWTLLSYGVYSNENRTVDSIFIVDSFYIVKLDGTLTFPHVVCCFFMVGNFVKDKIPPLSDSFLSAFQSIP